MRKEDEFFTFLLEYYAKTKDRSAPAILSEWEAAGIIPKIYDMYEQYHCERLENAFEDIDEMQKKS